MERHLLVTASCASLGRARFLPSVSVRGIVFATALVLSTSLSFGQSGLATVTGVVTDTTGAIIANAPITVKNLDNGAVFTGASSTTGNFTVSQLPIGDYDLTISYTGFKTYNHAKFHLSANQTVQEDVKLEVGTIGDKITVSADASMLQTESSELSHNITLSQMNNLPILQIGVSNQGFRDPLSAVRLLAGVRYLQTATSNTMIVNGTASNSVQLRLDGQTQGALGTASFLVGAIGQHQPSVDAIEEVAIQTSNFAAEYGTAGGAVINMVSKSGTNQYHGTAYDYMRNEALDAHNPSTGLRNKVRQNDWGFTFGGPVRIPKLYNGTNKTFFFWNYEQYRNKQILVTTTSTVPTPAYRAGDFSNLLLQENRLLTVAAPAGGCAAGTAAATANSCNYVDPLGRTIASGTIFDPLNTVVASNGTTVRNPFTDNKIPLTRFDPTSVKILAMVPQPLGPNATRGQAGNNYQLPANLTRISQIPSLKVDQNLGTKNKVSFYWSSTKTRTPRSPTGIDNFPDTITASNTSDSVARSARINWDQTVTPRFLLHYGIGWNDIDFRLGSPVINYNAQTELGLRQAVVRNFPRISTTGLVNAANGGMSPLGPASQTITMERRPAINVTGTYVLGRHTFKGGAEFRLEKYPNYNLSNTNGTYGFATTYTGQSALQGVTTNAGFTGSELASFMLGGYNNLTMAAPIQASSSKSQTALYVQDNWKATRKLTVDYGVRWDYGTYAKEQYGRFSAFNASVPSPAASGRLGARQFEAVCKCHFASNYPYAIGPRLGAAYQINRKTVLRAGLGLVYNATSQAAGGPVNTSFSPTVAPYQVIGNLKDGTPAAVNPVWPNFDPAAGFTTGSVNPMPMGLDPNAGRPSRQLQWNVTVQREINRNLVIEVAYVANRVVWTEANGLVNLNNMNVPTLNRYGFTDLTSLADSQMLTATMSALSAAQKATLAQRGVNLPYPNFPTTQILRQSLLPFPQYTGQSVNGAPLGKTWYDSMQLTLNKRFSHGLTGTFNYTYSKSLDWNTSPDPYNRPLGKNLGGFDQPHQTRLNLQYVIPQTSRTSLPVLSNKWVSQAVSGWGLGWYSAYQSAGLVGRPSSAGSVPINNFLGYGPGSAQQVIGADGKPMNPWSVDWTDYSGVHHTDPIDVNCHCFDPTKTVVLNPAAWTNIPNGQFGASQSSIRGFRGIRFPTENANMSRNFRFGKDGKYNLNVRVEFTNIFNRLQYPGIALGNFATAPTKFATGPFTGLYSGGFGTINPTAGTSATPRLGTFVGRLTF